MAWEYLDNLDYRYKRIAPLVLESEHVVDVNSGNSRLRDFVSHYVSNDLYDSRADYQVTDADFVPMVQECDVLCLFGIGGFEVTNEPLESSTVTDSVITLTLKHKPRLLVLECVNDFMGIADRILKETEYEPVRTWHDVVSLEVTSELDFVRHRTMQLCKSRSIRYIKI